PESLDADLAFGAGRAPRQARRIPVARGPVVGVGGRRARARDLPGAQALELVARGVGKRRQADRQGDPERRLHRPAPAGTPVPAARGKQSVTHVPFPTSLSIFILPPFAWTSSWAIIRPIPPPAFLVLTDSLASRAKTDSSMPGPRSRNAISTWPSATWTSTASAFSCEPSIASIAFLTTLNSTCWTCALL